MSTKSMVVKLYYYVGTECVVSIGRLEVLSIRLVFLLWVLCGIKGNLLLPTFEFVATSSLCFAPSSEMSLMIQCIESVDKIHVKLKYIITNSMFYSITPSIFDF